jgi:hypothetical protein
MCIKLGDRMHLEFGACACQRTSRASEDKYTEGAYRVSMRIIQHDRL